MTGLEVRRAGRVVLVQDSKAPASGGGVMQAWSVDEWAALVRVIKQDAVHTDILSKDPVLPLVIFGLHRHDPLYVDLDDWAPFVAAVKAGEYDVDKLSSGDAASPVSADGAVRVVAGAGKAGNPPSAPAATADGPPLDAIAGNRPGDPVREGIASAQGSEWRPSPATGAGEPGPDSSRPAPVAASSGPNVAAMDVPAGRPTPAPAQVALPQEAGRPGLVITDEAVIAAAQILKANAESHGVTTTVHTMRLWARAALAAALPHLIDSEPRWGSGPLVNYESSRIGVAAGGGEAGPGSPPVGPGPAEPSGGVS